MSDLQLRYVILTIVGAYLVFIFYLEFGISTQDYCRFSKKYYKEEISGEIIDKYIDHKNHGIEKLKIKTNNQIQVLNVDNGNPEYVLFLNSIIGDSIFNKSNSLKFTIKRDGRVQFYDIVHFWNCDSILFKKQLGAF